MIFHDTPLEGAYVIDPELREDDRGFFARTWCVQEFEEKGLNTNLVQCNISFNKRMGTLRGMHFQAAPYEEAKLVRCTMGSLFDVVIDLRPASETHLQWFGVELSAENRRMLFIPQGLAHGFQTLEDNTEVFYQMSEFYHPECARGVRWNDPLFSISWPFPAPILSDRDASYPDWSPK